VAVSKEGELLAHSAGALVAVALPVRRRDVGRLVLAAVRDGNEVVDRRPIGMTSIYRRVDLLTTEVASPAVALEDFAIGVGGRRRLAPAA
jgi:pimeloyl-ACP methyl ester carboxylesterase